MRAIAHSVWDIVQAGLGLVHGVTISVCKSRARLLNMQAFQARPHVRPRSAGEGSSSHRAYPSVRSWWRQGGSPFTRVGAGYLFLGLACYQISI